MKNLILFTAIFVVSTPLMAQFKKVKVPDKNLTELKVKDKTPITSPNRPLKAQELGTMPIYQAALPVKLVKTFQMPDGTKQTTELIRNPVNLPSNIGGSVKTNPGSKSSQDMGNKICTTEIISVNAESSSFMNANYSQQATYLTPGTLYSFNDFFSGNFKEHNTARNPVTLISDNTTNTTGQVSENVQSPSLATLVTAVGSLTRSYSTSSGSSSLQYRIFISDNESDLSIKLTGGGGYAGFQASASYNNNQSNKTYFLTIDAIKPMYTITTSIESGGIFPDPSQPQSKKDLIMIKSVTYGTRILANLTITMNSQSDDINFKAQYGKEGVSPNVNAMFNYLKTAKNTTTTANGYVVGGPMNTTIFNTDKLQQEITALLAQCNYQTAKPIAYSFCDMQGNILGIKSGTDQFTVTSCLPKDSEPVFTGAKVTITTGSDNKEQGSVALVTLAFQRSEVWDPTFQNIIGGGSSQNYNTEFTPNSQNDLFITPYSSSLGNSINWFRNGGAVDIFLTPSSSAVFGINDQWDIKSAVVEFYFKDQYNVQTQKTLRYDNINAKLLKNQQRLRLTFNGSIQATGSYMPQ